MTSKRASRNNLWSSSFKPCSQARASTRGLMIPGVPTCSKRPCPRLGPDRVRVDHKEGWCKKWPQPLSRAFFVYFSHGGRQVKGFWTPRLSATKTKHQGALDAFQLVCCKQQEGLDTIDQAIGHQGWTPGSFGCLSLRCKQQCIRRPMHVDLGCSSQLTCSAATCTAPCWTGGGPKPCGLTGVTFHTFLPRCHPLLDHTIAWVVGLNHLG